MPNHLAKLRNLSWAERRLLVVATLLLALTEVGLRLFGFQGYRWWLSRWVRGERLMGQQDLEQASTVARMVAIGARHGPLRASCLRQALVLWFLLARRGVPARLRIGATRGDDGLRAHAWVELGERVLIGGDQGVRERYAVLL